MRINGKNVASLTINGRSVATLEINGKEAWSAKDPAAYNLNDGEIEAVYSRVLYTGEPVTAWIEVKDVFGDVLQEGRAYELEYADNVDVGTATVTARGIGRYYGELTTQFDIVTNDVSDPSYEFELDPASFPADASSYDVTVTGQDPTGEYMTEGDDFTVYNDQAGTVTITGIGRYTGTTTRTYEIIPSVEYLTFTALQDNSTLKLSRVGTWTDSDPVVTFEADTGTGWTEYTLGTTLTLNENQQVKFRGNAPTDQLGVSASKYHKFEMTGRFGASGNVMTLLNPNGKGLRVGNFGLNRLFYGASGLVTPPELPATSLGGSSYAYMFMSCSNLTAAPELPATTLADRCYDTMFNGCNSLTAAPELPAFNLAEYCYYQMFFSCKGLTAAPELTATTLAPNCYQSMFRFCEKLTAAPELPATALRNYCYAYMFDSCTSLTAAPELPATTMQRYCYQNMFNGCTGLTTAPELPATELAGYCYSGMFSGCSNLTAAPELPVTTMQEYCYRNMFQNCRSLTAAPELPATTLASNCYNGMFQGCTSLTDGPSVLPAATLETYCCQSMFQGCSNLTAAPELPATALGTGCYRNMFQNCSNLTTAPELPATSLASYCYEEMFSGCSKLQKIKVQFTEWPTDWTRNWVNNVAADGTFICPDALPDERGVNRIPENWTKQAADYLKFTALENGSTITLNAVGSPAAVNLEYRTNHEDTWHEYTPGTTLSMFKDWEVEFRGNNLTLGTSENDYYQFAMAGSFAASGSVMTLLDKTDTLRSVPDYCMVKLFNGCASLVRPPKLPATSVGGWGYSTMFNECSNLTAAPDLGEIQLGQRALQYMFRRCTSLVDASNVFLNYENAPDAFSNMFFECTSLKYAGPVDKIKTVANKAFYYAFRGCSALEDFGDFSSLESISTQGMEGMFYNCTSLRKAPEIPATTLDSRALYETFRGCSSMTAAMSELPATVANDSAYKNMFVGCTSLTASPAVKATTLYVNALDSMFYGCTSMNKITVSFTSWTTAQGIAFTTNWCAGGGVAPTGEFHCPAGLPEIRGANNIPNGWTIIRDVA